MKQEQDYKMIRLLVEKDLRELASSAESGDRKMVEAWHDNIMYEFDCLVIDIKEARGEESE